MTVKIAVLSGGVGGARFVRALSYVTDQKNIHALVNVGDDFWHFGLKISPDIDSVIYHLAGINDEERGWGLRDETYSFLDQMSKLGMDTWFTLGDRDLATHVIRTELLLKGLNLTQVTRELCKRLNISVNVLPITDSEFPVQISTEDGRVLSFQDYFVREGARPKFKEILTPNCNDASISNEARETLETAHAIMIAPSNPLLSIEPILRVGGVKEILKSKSHVVHAVSPIIKGQAIKGPLKNMLLDLGLDPNPLILPHFYGELCGSYIIDVLDTQYKDEFLKRGFRVRTVNTLMKEPDSSRALAKFILENL